MGLDAAGNAWAVWDLHDDTASDVWAARFTPEGGWAAAQRVDDAHPGNAWYPHLALDAAGHAVVTWWASGAGLWAKRFDPDAGWADAELVDSAAFGGHAAVNGRGEVVIVYPLQEGTTAVPLGTTLMGKRYTPTTGWTQASMIDTTLVEGVESYGLTAPPSLSSAQVALTADGTALALYLFMGHPGAGLAFASSPAGAGWSSQPAPPNPAESQGPEGASAPLLFSTRGGDVVAGWTPQPFFNGAGRVLSSRYDSETGNGPATGQHLASRPHASGRDR